MYVLPLLSLYSDLLCFGYFFSGIVVTNDGNAILREIDIAHPAAKVCQIMLVAQL